MSSARTRSLEITDAPSPEVLSGFRAPVNPPEQRSVPPRLRQSTVANSAPLRLIFDKNCRYDINDKLERVGEPYMDLDCLGRALNTEKINDYSGSLVL